MKRIGWIVAMLLGALIVLLLALPYVISSDSFKQQLIARISAATGRQLKIDGPLRLKFFPYAGAHAEQVTFSNPAHFASKQPFMQLQSMDVQVRLLPLLLHKEIEIAELAFAAPQINLQIDARGVRNWDFPSPAKKAAAPKAPVQNTAPPASAAAMLRNLEINHVGVKDGALFYHNLRTGDQWQLQHINAAVALKGADAPFTIGGNAEWNRKQVKLDAAIDSVQSWLSGGRATLNANLSTDLLTLEAKGALEAVNRFNGKIDVGSPSLRQLLAWLAPQSPPLATPAALALKLNGDATCSMTECGLRNAVLSLDSIEGKGSLMAAFGANMPRIELMLTTNQINLNDFLPPPDKQRAAGGLLIAPAFADAPAAGWSAQPIDLSPLRRVNIAANIQAAGLVFRHITLGKAGLHVMLQNGRLEAMMPDLALYGGKGNISLRADGNAGEAQFDSRILLTGVQAGPLLKDALDSDRVSGAASMAMNVSGHGKSEKDIIGALAGKGWVSFANGVIKGVDLAGMLSNLQSAFQSANSLAANSTAQQTSFTSMMGNFTIAQGIVTNNDLAISNAVLNISGSGQVDLPARTVHYRLTPQLATMAKGKEGLTVPVLVEGSIDDPRFRPDVKGAVQDAFKDPKKFKERLSNSKNAVKSLKGLLKGLSN